jgi:hypothetical protein
MRKILLMSTKKKIEGHQSFMEFDEAGLVELATRDVELMEEEESSPSMKCLQKSQRIIEREQRRSRLNACVAKADSDVDNF